MHPWLIDLPTCPSTSTWALQRLDALAHGACVWTERQTAGRGRGGKTWEAPPGVLTASFVLRPRTRAPQFALAAGLAVCHAVEDLLPSVDCRLKWPNDVLIGEGKLAGILCEGSERALVVGIGLNVDPRWPDDGPLLRRPPASLAEHGAVPATADLLAGLRRYLLEASGLIDAGGWPRIIAAWRERDALHGRTVTISDGTNTHEGRVDGIADDGALLLDGRRITAGTVA